MKALLISGSSSRKSTNTELLTAISNLDSILNIVFAHPLTSLPLYSADDDHTSIPDTVSTFRQQIISADCVIISTPEYLHNIPAVLKNSLEWLKSGGELQAKKVIPICYTPKEPRGEKALESLVNSLIALEATLVCKIRLFHQDIILDDDGSLMSCIGKDIITESLALLK